MAIRTISNAGGSWSSTSTWVEGAVPTSTDDVVCTATSGNLSLPAATLDCLSINLTGYTGTLSGVSSAVLRFRGALTLGGTITATSILQQTTNNVTITSNGITWTGSYQFITSSINANLSGAFTIAGDLLIGSNVFNGSNLNLQGNLTLNNNTGFLGTSTIILNGTGSQTWSGNFLLRGNNLTINKPSGTFIVSGNIQFGANILTYTTSGAVTVTGSTLSLGSSCTLATNGMSWDNITFTGTSQTYTLTNNLTANGTVTFFGATAQTINGSTLICNGNLTSISGSVFVTGTTNISMRGTSTIVGSSGGYALNIDINTAGTISFTGILYFRSGTFSLTSGTINAGTSTINHFSAGSFILSLGNANLYNVTLNSTSSIGTALNCSGTLIISATSLNTYTVNCSGSLSVTGASSGTSTINMTGTGTLSCSGTANTLNNTLNINTSGTITLGVIFSYFGKTWTLVSGTLVKGGTVYCMATTTTTVFDLGNTNIGNLQISGTTQTLTLASNLSCDNFAPGSNATINGNNLNINGGISTISNTILNGATVLNLVGTGTWNWNSATSQGISNTININTSGTITLGQYVCLYLGCTLNYVSGTIINTSSTLYINGSTPVTINASGMNFNDVVINSGTASLSSVLNVSGTLSTAVNAIFSGTSGFITNNFSITTAGRTITLKNGVTYTVNNSLTITGTVGSRITIQSSTTSSAFFNLNPAATQSVTNTNATWIDSSGGKTIWSSAGTLSNTVNWNIGTGASGMYKFFFG